MISVDVKHKLDLVERLQKFKGEVAYGVPRETAHQRTHDNKNLDKPTYNNAEILSLMENGSIINKIPKRELLKPVREKHQAEIEKMLMSVCSQLLSGEEAKANELMEKLAQRIEGWTKKFFVEDNGWAPNAPITIYGGWMRNKATGKPIYVKGKGSDRPLIDTGSLRQSIKAIYYKGGKK